MLSLLRPTPADPCPAVCVQHCSRVLRILNQPVPGDHCCHHLRVLRRVCGPLRHPHHTARCWSLPSGILSRPACTTAYQAGYCAKYLTTAFSPWLWAASQSLIVSIHHQFSRIAYSKQLLKCTTCLAICAILIKRLIVSPPCVCVPSQKVQGVCLPLVSLHRTLMQASSPVMLTTH